MEREFVGFIIVFDIVFEYFFSNFYLCIFRKITDTWSYEEKFFKIAISNLFPVTILL